MFWEIFLNYWKKTRRVEGKIRCLLLEKKDSITFDWHPIICISIGRYVLHPWQKLLEIQMIHHSTLVFFLIKIVCTYQHSKLFMKVIFKYQLFIQLLMILHCIVWFHKHRLHVTILYFFHIVIIIRLLYEKQLSLRHILHNRCSYACWLGEWMIWRNRMIFESIMLLQHEQSWLIYLDPVVIRRTCTILNINLGVTWIQNSPKHTMQIKAVWELNVWDWVSKYSLQS